MVKKDEMELLLKRSKRFLETAEYQFDIGYYDLAMFSLEQASQLFLKAKLLENGVDYPRSRSVAALLEMLGKVAEEKREAVETLMEKYLTESGLLEDAYITSKYVAREYRREEVKKAMESVKTVMKSV